MLGSSRALPPSRQLTSDHRSPGRVLLDGLGWALIVLLAGAGTLAGFALLMAGVQTEHASEDGSASRDVGGPEGGA